MVKLIRWYKLPTAIQNCNSISKFMLWLPEIPYNPNTITQICPEDQKSAGNEFKKKWLMSASLYTALRKLRGPIIQSADCSSPENTVLPEDAIKDFLLKNKNK